MDARDGAFHARTDEMGQRLRVKPVVCDPRSCVEEIRWKARQSSCQPPLLRMMVAWSLRCGCRPSGQGATMHEYRPTFPVVNRFQNPSRPAAPPVYRPQPRIAASAGQVSVFAGAHAPQGRGNTAQLQPAGSMRMGNSASARRPAPPVYKPQPMGSAVQPSAAIAPPTSLATQGGRQATAPPVYKPQTQLSAAQSPLGPFVRQPFSRRCGKRMLRRQPTGRFHRQPPFRSRAWPVPVTPPFSPLPPQQRFRGRDGSQRRPRRSLSRR